MSRITYNHFADEIEEAGFLSSAISTLIEAGENPEDIVVLYRTNRQSRAPEDTLMAAKVPYRIIGAYGFFQRAQVKAITSYLKIVAGIGGEAGAEALVRAVQVQTPRTQYVGVKSAEKAAQVSPNDPVMGLPRIPGIRGRQVETLAAFTRIILDLRTEAVTTPLPELIQRMADVTGLTHWLEIQKGEDDSTPETNGDGAKSVLQDVIESAKPYETLADFLTYVQDREDTASNPADLKDKGHGQVTLVTIHRSKGLEWKHVYGIGWAIGLLPHKMSIGDEDAIEEERRAAYVCMTRAVDYLTLTSMDVYAGKSAGASPFLGEAGLTDEINEGMN